MSDSSKLRKILDQHKADTIENNELDNSDLLELIILVGKSDIGLTYKLAKQLVDNFEK